MEYLNEIIDNLCNKLGTTAEVLIPEYSKMRIAELTFLRNVNAFLVTILFLIFIFIGYIFIKKYPDMRGHKEDVFESFITLVGIPAAIILVIVMVGFIINQRALIAFTTSPTAATIKELLGGIK